MDYIAFRTLLKKVGSGSHTSKHLTRQESAEATQMMLQQIATPAQIGAFMIAQRIKRPTPDELAGMLDCYDALGPRLRPIESTYPVTVQSSPYDGRSRTMPVSPLVALILAAAQAPIILHGGDRMPTKMGLPLVEVWQALGVNWQTLSLEQSQDIFETTGVGFVYQPEHFPLAQALVPYRIEIGKRPTLATVELMWSPYQGQAHVVSGFVHPPTEDRTRITYEQRETQFYTTVKGLEGSCDIPRARTAIIGMGQHQAGQSSFERLLLHPRDYGFEGEDPAPVPLAEMTPKLLSILAGDRLADDMNELAQSVIWNGGFYLWRCGAAPSLDDGLEQAKTILVTGQAQNKLHEIQREIAICQNQISGESTPPSRVVQPSL